MQKSSPDGRRSHDTGNDNGQNLGIKRTWNFVVILFFILDKKFKLLICVLLNTFFCFFHWDTLVFMWWCLHGIFNGKFLWILGLFYPYKFGNKYNFVKTRYLSYVWSIFFQSSKNINYATKYEVLILWMTFNSSFFIHLVSICKKLQNIS